MQNKTLLAYLQLFRLPNVFTAVSNVVMGFVFTKWFNADGDVIGWTFVLSYMLPLVFASCCLYIGGMVLNDVYDYDVDKVERPDRPLPSGRIDRGWAKQLGFGLLIIGIGLAFSVGVSPKPGMLAILLAGAIYLYDSVAKKTAIAPILMGSCRTLNILLGMSYVLFTPDQLLVAFGIGTYVAGITWFARCEAKASNPNMLKFGMAVMVLGICLLGAWPWFRGDNSFALRDPILWPTLLALLMVSVVRRCVLAISDPKPENVQAAVKHSIFSLIVLDAAVVLAVAGPIPAIAVIALLLPTIWLGRWVYST